MHDVSCRAVTSPRGLPVSACRPDQRSDTPASEPERCTSVEQGEAGGETVDVVGPAHRSELPGTEPARDRHGTERVVDDRGVVVRAAEEPLAAAGAGEEQRPGRV